MNTTDFVCKCGCGGNKIDPVFVDMLKAAEGFAGVPFAINSGYRCEAYNRSDRIKSKSDNHPSGQAADISCTDGPTRMKIVAGLVLAGFRRIGYNRVFIHADRMDQSHGKVQSLWPY